MRSFTLLSLTGATAATQIPFFIPGFMGGEDYATPVASIVSAAPSTTIMALSCPSDAADDSECPWGELDMTVGVISSTIFSVDVPLAQVTFDCTSKKDMTCTAAIAQEFTDAGMDGFTAGSDGTATGTTVYPSAMVALQTASIIGGLEKLSAGAGAESSVAKTSAAPKETSESKAASSTMKTTGSPAATGATPSETGAVETGAASQTTGAAPEEATGAAARFGVQGAALLALAGAAVVQVL